MASVKAIIKEQHYITHISGGTNTITADEPLENGGCGAGFNPSELLASSLAACTSITLRMYADRKGYALEQVTVDVSFTRDAALNITNIIRQIELTGNLKTEERKRMLEIANGCPIHKILSHEISIKTDLK